MLAAVIGIAACGGGGSGGSDPAPGTAPPPSATSFSFPVVPTTTTPQGCVREDGKAGVSAVTYYKRSTASDLDQVVLRCDSSSGRRVLRSRPGSIPALLYVDAAGTVVAELRDTFSGALVTLFAMLPGSDQEIELAAQSGPYPPTQFVAVFNDRALYLTRDSGRTALVSVTISQTPTTTVLTEVSGTMWVHDRLVGGRAFFATVSAGPSPTIEFLSIRPDGTDRLSLRSASIPGQPFLTIAVTLRDREVIYYEQWGAGAVPSIRMLAIDTPGSDLLIAEAVLERALAVPGAADRFIFIGRYPNTTEPVLTDVTAERANLSIKTLVLSQRTGDLPGFSQGRLYFLNQFPSPTLSHAVSWLGEGGTAPRTVLTGLRRAYLVTDRAIAYSRTPYFSNRISYLRSDLDGTNEREGSDAAVFLSPNQEAPTQAGERICYLRNPDTIDNHVAAFDLATGVETVVYRPNPPQDYIRFFRVGGRLIIWRGAPGADSGWIDSIDLDGNDLRRLDQSPDGVLPQPF